MHYDAKADEHVFSSVILVFISNTKNTLVGAETVRHSSTYIILYIMTKDHTQSNGINAADDSMTCRTIHGVYNNIILTVIKYVAKEFSKEAFISFSYAIMERRIIPLHCYSLCFISGRGNITTLMQILAWFEVHQRAAVYPIKHPYCFAIRFVFGEMIGS